MAGKAKSKRSKSPKKKADKAAVSLRSLLGWFVAAATALGAVWWQQQPSDGPDKPPASLATATAEPVTFAKAPNFAGQPKFRRDACELKVLENPGFTVGYCEDLKNPAWVSYRLFPVEKKPSLKRPGRFRIDKRTSAAVSHDDYTKSGYDRGHMAPNHGIATRFGKEGQAASFLMSNVVPQRPALNRKLWRILEERIADDYAHRLEGVWIVTGPIYDDERETLPSGVQIPDAFFKIVVDDEGGKPRALALLVPQAATRKTPTEQLLTTVDDIEKRTGLDFFPALPDGVEDRLESQRATALW